MCDGVIKITQPNGCYWVGVVSLCHPLKDSVPSELPSEHTQRGAGTTMATIGAALGPGWSPASQGVETLPVVWRPEAPDRGEETDSR